MILHVLIYMVFIIMFPFLFLDSSDMQLAIALQQQEFEQQPQQSQGNVQQPTVSGSSRLVTGPQVRFNFLPLKLL